MSNDMPPQPPFSETDAIGIRDALARMIPRSLDDVVRKHRELVQIGLATAEEIAVRTKRVGLGHSRDTIENWRIVAYRAGVTGFGPKAARPLWSRGRG